jgi:preprotein translocase subunit SecE
MNPSETIKDWTDRSKQFYQDVRNEMKKVSWPGRQEIVGTTVVVVAAVFFFGLYFFAVDSFLSLTIDRVYKYFGIGG